MGGSSAVKPSSPPGAPCVLGGVGQLSPAPIPIGRRVLQYPELDAGWWSRVPALSSTGPRPGLSRSRRMARVARVDKPQRKKKVCL